MGLGWVGEQLRRVDEDFADGRASDGRLAGFVVLATVLLVLLRYIGKSSYIVEVEAAQALFASLPYPELGPKLYWSAFRILAYIVVPGLYIHFVLRERFRDLGFRFERSPKVLALYAAMFAAILPLVYAASFSEAFLRKYPFYDHAGRSVEEFLIWELAYVAQFFALEFFFRGLLLFTLARRVGALAIFLVAVPYALIHVGKPLPETLGAIITGIVLGTLALRTRSIYGGVLVHSAVGVSMDLFALLQKGAFS